MKTYEIDVEDVEYLRHGDKAGVGEAFMTNDPTSPQSQDAIAKIIEFVHREITPR